MGIQLTIIKMALLTLRYRTEFQFLINGELREHTTDSFLSPPATCMKTDGAAKRTGHPHTGAEMRSMEKAFIQAAGNYSGTMTFLYSCQSIFSSAQIAIIKTPSMEQ